MARITKKTFELEVERRLEDGTLRESPIAYIGASVGNGTRFVFVDGYVALGPREAIEHLANL